MSRVDAPLTPEQQDELYLPLIPDLRDVAREGYGDPDHMKYHAWQGHIEPVREHNLGFREAQLEAGVDGVPGQFITETTSDFHDYLLESYLLALARGKVLAPTAEIYAGNESGKILRKKGVDRFTVAEFQETIRGTEAGVVCDTLAKLNLCCADLFNTGEDYETVMKADTAKLRDEKEYITQIEVDETVFGIGSLHYLAKYYFKNLWVPDLLRSSRTNLDFYIRFGQNLTTMGLEQVRSVGEEAIKGIVQVVADLQTRLPILKKFQLKEPKDQAVS